MNKKLVTLLCILSLLVTAFGVTAAAENANAVAEVKGTYYDTIEEAINAVDPEDLIATVITLQKPVTETVTFDKTVYLNLNGQNIGPVIVAEGCTLYCFDTQTDDCKIEGDAETGYYGFGRLTVSDSEENKGEIVGVAAGEYFDNSYLKVTEDNGISFHCVKLQIDTMTLRPQNDGETEYNPGMYYKSVFAGDELVAKNVQKFGIALSTTEEPDAENFGVTNKCSVYKNFTAGAEGNANLTSTYVKNILKESNGRLTNTSHAMIPIYGRAYALTTGGDYIFGKCETNSFQKLIQGLSKTNNPEKLAAAIPLYRVYGHIMRNWEDVSNLESAVISDKTNPVISSDKDKPLRILAITSSFGKNTTELLYDVLTAEGYTDVTVARLYTSGGMLWEHVNFARENTEAYQYTYISNETNGKWIKTHDDAKVANKTLPSASMWEVLAQGWDVIFLQQSAAHSPQLNTYGTYIDQLMEQLALHNPNHENTKYIWNMTWSYQRGYVDDVFSRYDYDQMKMYQSCVKAVQEKVVHRTDFEAITPSGTAIQNARIRHLDDENDLTSDGRHANALGRTVAAYAVYAAITAQPLEQIQLTNIGNTDTTYEIEEITLTESQKAIILESVNAAIANPFHVTEP